MDKTVREIEGKHMPGWFSHMPTQMYWIMKALFTCHHFQTPVKEGKCFCPNCGRGIVFQWVVLRCGYCRTRRDSRYYLRQILPTQACCAQCGESEFYFEYIDMILDGTYYQLNKARLSVQEADKYLARRFCWSTTASLFHDTFQETLQKTRAWLDPSTQSPVLQPLLIPSNH